MEDLHRLVDKGMVASHDGSGQGPAGASYPPPLNASPMDRRSGQGQGNSPTIRNNSAQPVDRDTAEFLEWHGCSPHFVAVSKGVKRLCCTKGGGP